MTCNEMAEGNVMDWGRCNMVAIITFIDSSSVCVYRL